MTNLPAIWRRSNSQCTQCGQCCRDLHLTVSLEDIKHMHGAAARAAITMLIPLESPMQDAFGRWPIMGPCGGVHAVYHYRCRFVITLGNGKSACAIYHVRPTMCSEFPHYWLSHPDPENSHNRHSSRWPFPSQYLGCGFNHPRALSHYPLAPITKFRLTNTESGIRLVESDR